MADEAAERVAQSFFMQWGVIDDLPMLTEEQTNLAERWLTDLLLTHAREARQRALEEAAQIADSFRDPDRDTLGYQEAENIATTIRALKEPTR